MVVRFEKIMPIRLGQNDFQYILSSFFEFFKIPILVIMGLMKSSCRSPPRKALKYVLITFALARQMVDSEAGAKNRIFEKLKKSCQNELNIHFS